MNVLVVLIPASLVLGLFGLVGFLWTIRTCQYDDPLGEASRVLLDADNDLHLHQIEISKVALDQHAVPGQAAMAIDHLETDP